MPRLYIGQSLIDGFSILTMGPAILIPVGINTACFMFQMQNPATGAFLGTMLLNFFLYFLTTQYAYDVLLGNPSWKAAFHFMRPRWVTLFCAVFVWMVAVVLGIFALIIPGILLLVRLGFCDYAVIFHGKSVMESCKESWRLTEGSFWRVLMILCILYLPDLAAEFLPKTNPFLVVKFLLLFLSQAMTLTTMLAVYIKLRDIKEYEAGVRS